MADSTNTYFEVLDAIKNYYGSGSDQWVEFAKYGITADNAEAILHQVPGVEIIKNADGSIRSYTYNAIETVSSSASTLNSNALSTQVKTKIPANMGVDSSTGNLTLKSGVATAGNFVVGSVAPAVGAAMLGITVGKTFDKLLYESMPDFWDAHGMATLDPDTWNTITTDDTLGGYLFNTLLNLNPDNNTTQAYMDENAIAYLAYYMQVKGVFDEGYYESADESTYKYYDEIKDYVPLKYTKKITYPNGNSDYVDSDSVLIVIDDPSYSHLNYLWISAGANTSNGIYYEYKKSTDTTKSTSISSYDKFFNFYFISSTAVVSKGYTGIKNVCPDSKYKYLIDYYFNGNIRYVGAIDGVGTQSGATTPDLSLAQSVDEVLTLLKEQYPELWEKAITQDVIQSDGTIKTYVYIPVATPNAKSATDTQPTSDTSTQTDPVINPDTSPETLLNLIASIAGSTPTPIDTNTESETGKGSTPSLIVPTGSASALYKIYNPTQEQLNSFGAWLWSSDFVDQLLKLFNDPMQAIIGLHKVYTPVSVGGTSDIKVGYLSSGVTSNYISNQYVSVDCGSIDLKEFFNNIFDYDPYTDIHIYLPFIGIQKLNTGDVMRSSINVTYHVDVLTGACLAEINITRDGGGGILYTYSGNCAVQYPISSGSYMGIVASLASVAGGIVGTVATGGAMAPMTIGAVGGLMNAHTSVSHSGGFSGNSGAMGVKIPYLIITRPQTELANTFPSINGYPTNYSVTLGQCSGYVEIENCHVSGIPATDVELSEIETLLKSGVIL